MVRSRLLTAVAAFSAACCVAAAHPGRTDARGGHTDHSTGQYHMHNGGRSGGGGMSGGGGGGYNVPRQTVPPPMRIIYTPPPKKTYAPRKPHEPSYAVTHGLKLHTFHTSKGKILTRGEAKSLDGGHVPIIRANGDKVVKPFVELAIADRAKVAFDLAAPTPKESVSGTFEMFGTPPIEVNSGAVPIPRAHNWEKDFRGWTSGDGKFSARAKAAELTGTKVLLRIENSTRVVPVAIEKLSEDDQQYLAELEEAAVIPVDQPVEDVVSAK